MAVTRNMVLAAAAMTRPAPPESSDATLAERLARGEEGALEEVIALHGRRVSRLAHRLLGWSAADADDVVQEVFLSVLRQRHGFRQQATLSTWPTTITLNKCRSHRRSWLAKLRGVIRHRREVAARGPSLAGADEEVRCIERGEAVRRAVGGLRETDREVIVLFYLEQLPREQIGQILGISSNAVEVRLHRARQRLREKLAGLMEE